MKIPSGTELILGMICGLLAGYALWGRGKPPVVSPATQARIAALAADSARFWAYQDSARKAALVFQAQAAKDTARMAALAASAKVAGHRADSLAAVAARFPVPPDDSNAIYFREAYRARSVEADSLRTAGDLAFQAMRGAMATANLCLKAQIDAEGRLSQEQQVNADLQAVIARSRAPSRWTLGVGAGYGLAVAGGKVYAAPVVSLGVSYALRLPKIF